MRRLKNFFNNLLFAAFLVFQFLARILPERMSYMLGRGIGLLAYGLLPDLRLTAKDNIRQALGYSDKAASRLAREVSASLGLLGVEFLRFSGRREALKKRVVLRGEEHIRDALAMGRGAILLVAHLGNWELCGQAMCLAGYPLHPIVKVQASGRFYDIIDRERRRSGIMPIPRGFSLREMLRALRQGECVTIMPDQHASKGVVIPFFGRPASTPRGIAILARLSKSPVVPTFFRRLSPGHHEVRFHPPLDLIRTENEEADTIANLTKINAVLEEVIREAPEQWLWLHKRWKAGFEPGTGGSDP